MDLAGTVLKRDSVRDLITPIEPGISLYLGLEPTELTGSALHDLELRWRAIAARLAEAGADVPTIEAVGRYISSLPVYPTEVAAFAQAGRIVLGQPIPGGMRFDRFRFGSPPDAAPLLSWRQRHPAYVVVMTDRTGADITTVPDGAAAGPTVSVVGPDDEIERNAPGGWSQARYQRRAEDSWQHNAGAVADRVVDELSRAGARLLLIGGDVRAEQLLREHLPHGALRGITVHHLPGGRNPDGSAEARRTAITTAVREHTQRHTDTVWAQFAAERAPGGLAVDGVRPTLAALVEGRVGTLLVPDGDDDREAWFGPDLLCAPDRATAAEGSGASGRVQAGRLVDIAARAALLTDAEVRVIDADQATQLEGRIGAICRFTGRP